MHGVIGVGLQSQVTIRNQLKDVLHQASLSDLRQDTSVNTHGTAGSKAWGASQIPSCGGSAWACFGSLPRRVLAANTALSTTQLAGFGARLASSEAQELDDGAQMPFEGFAMCDQFSRSSPQFYCCPDRACSHRQRDEMK